MQNKNIERKVISSGKNLTLGIQVNRTNPALYHETKTPPYTQGSRLNPDYSNIQTGDTLINSIK